MVEGDGELVDDGGLDPRVELHVSQVGDPTELLILEVETCYSVDAVVEVHVVGSVFGVI